MDTLFWQTFNPKIKFGVTKKQFYGRFLWRLELECSGSDLASKVYDNSDINMLAAKRKNPVSNNLFYSWRNLATLRCPTNIELVESLRNIRLTHGDKIKLRTENPCAQIYTATEDDLKIISGELYSANCAIRITGPNLGTEELLQHDKIINNGRIKHQYKVVLRDGNYDVKTKAQILALLDAQDDIVKLTAGLRHGLCRPYPGTWGLFFYTNDLGIVTLLNLMQPGLVGKIHEVVCL